MFRMLVLLRRMEERTVEMFLSGKLPGWLHSYLGQEAIAVGVCAHLNEDDFVASTHRCRGHFLAKGMAPGPLMAEVMGKRDGICGGRGGEMHMADWSKGVIGSSGVVAGGLSLATGVAFASRYRKTGQVVVAFLGESATNQGAFHESLNLAAVWDLPILYVCENNGYGVSVPQRKAMKIGDVSVRAASYGMPGETIDGDDVIAVHRAAGRAVARARRGEGPTLLECCTHRWLGHFVGDPQAYRPKDELEACKRSDPIPRFEDYLLMEKVFTPAELEKVKAEVERQVTAAFEFATASPAPDPADALRGVFTEGTE
ncbi:MAG: thiamine pyrophosphate-dependent dehydrogenase E1 component subunit alpha [Chloroflexi bacterium]|nr:thiamine pyrophosphate-dependent dehydrogenase E1 component subunit alpha [Chloroflexota bacterium]